MTLNGADPARMTLGRYLDVCEALFVEDMRRIDPRTDVESMLSLETKAQPKPEPPANVAAQNADSLKMLMAQLPGGRMPG